MTVSSGRVTAVLGPTNTGKTHLAVERMCAHSSGMMGFPLRLLAREVYDRVVKLKGEGQTALITGEEKIIPANARYFLCTAESMPVDRDVAFLALDEAQMGADDERGHIFTERLLHARGREETMILGSAALGPLVKRLVRDVEVITRPRFSTLSFAGAKKLSRLPKRSAIIAFSAQEVYALAEALRRHVGGAAVVMGNLSPRTRNAQVAMYQSGEVDYLVATDAIGMGLNMDIAHVAFASLVKFDGKRRRRLTLSELGQIAGRAGRHQRDGTFGLLQLDSGQPQGLDADDVLALEEHRYPVLEQLFWRNSALDFHSPAALIRSLERPSGRPELIRADDAIDVAVLRLLERDEGAMASAKSHQGVKRLWSVCQLPDYLKSGPEPHSRLVARILGHLTSTQGVLPTDWIGGELARLDSIEGDIDSLATRIAGVRTWSFISHQQGCTQLKINSLMPCTTS
jgi:ATP-dependent RNA helicase SUPV3L1/SUV3